MTWEIFPRNKKTLTGLEGNVHKSLHFHHEGATAGWLVARRAAGIHGLLRSIRV